MIHMFKELIELWRSDNSLTQALNSSHTMLDTTYQMFRESVKSLRESEDGEIDNIYEMDQTVNEYERDVRRKVMKHLAITGGMNMIPGLILTSIVIDIERIGDYTKNIVDLAVAHPKRLVCDRFEEDIQRIEKGVTHLFEGIVPIFKSSDKQAAEELWNSSSWITKVCDEVVIQLINSNSSMDSTDAVATALYARYLKRIAAHILNITSSILNPFERIGFWEKGDN